MKESLLIFLKGLLMGFADVVPGVSGGTMAFITGIYDRLINSLKNVGTFLKLLSKPEKKIWKKIDFALFIPLGLGIAIAFGIGARVIPELMEKYPAEIYSFFIGLIMASAYFVYKGIKTHTLYGLLFFVAGLLLGVGISVMPVTQSAPSILFIFLLGAIAICAMLLPGVSGSYILLMFGQYEFMLHAIRDLAWAYVLTFMVGAVIGLLLFSRVLSYLLKEYHSITFYALLGLMIGALSRPTGKVIESFSAGAVIFLFVGLALVLGVERIVKRNS